MGLENQSDFVGFCPTFFTQNILFWPHFETGSLVNSYSGHCQISRMLKFRKKNDRNIRSDVPMVVDYEGSSSGM
jgi:hypothetical protein